jgi:crotonobetainyl-CoA:carnitine CoA-transferase CaiB-like acyl-CoA transferase
MTSSMGSPELLGPLNGVRVLDCSDSLGSAYSTATLERMGADVVRVEVVGARHRGPSAFLDADLSDSAVYRNYVGRSAPRRRLDLDVPSDVQALRELVANADAVLDDRREPLLEAAGIDVAVLDGPPPIVASLTPHGRTGPRRDDLASDLTVFHGAGPGYAVPGLVADPATMPPLRLGSHQGHFVSGLVTAVNLCAALFTRRRTGAVVTVDVSAHEALANSFRQSLGTFAYYGGGMSRELARGRGAGGMVDGRNLRCKDGYINIAWAGVQQWDSLQGALGQPEWMADPDLATPALRYRNWVKIVPKLEEWAEEFDKEHLLYLCQGFRIPCAPVLDGADLLESSALTSRGFLPFTAVGERAVTTSGRPTRAAPSSKNAEPSLPLQGIRVVDFTHFVSGPHCTMWLASLGAEVLKIESVKRPDAFRLSQLKANVAPTLNNSAIFATTNLMKRSCVIDIATSEGRDLCRGLIDKSDVVVANFRPGVLEQFGLDYATLSSDNPRLIMSVITGYGYTGDFAAFQALGPNIHAFSGLSAATGYPDGPPEQLFGTYADVLAGQVAALSIIAALHGRESTGRGEFIDTAMSEAMIALAPEAVLRAAGSGEPTVRQGNDEPGVAPHACYPTAGNDRWIALAAFDEEQWRAMLDVLDLQLLADDERFASIALRWTNRRELDRLISVATTGRDAAELAGALQKAGVAASPVRTAEDVMMDEQLVSDRFLASVTHGELGVAVLPTLPWRISIDGRSERPIGPAPDFGADTCDVLQSLLGVTDEAWVGLRSRGVVA